MQEREGAQPADLNERIPGVEIHATMLAQQLDGVRMHQVPDWVLWIVSVLVVGAAIATANWRGLP